MKKRIRLTESQLHNVIRKCVNEELNESSLSSNAANVLVSCKHNVRSVLTNLKNEFIKVYGLLSDAADDRDSFHNAMSAYSDLMGKFTYHTYEDQIHEAFRPVVDAYININTVDDKDFSEPEDWYERNEHGDFDNY